MDDVARLPISDRTDLFVTTASRRTDGRDHLAELEQHYHKMREMIFGEPPTFDRLLDVLREIERHVNGSRSLR